MSSSPTTRKESEYTNLVLGFRLEKCLHKDVSFALHTLVSGLKSWGIEVSAGTRSSVDNRGKPLPPDGPAELSDDQVRMLQGSLDLFAKMHEEQILASV